MTELYVVHVKCSDMGGDVTMSLMSISQHYYIGYIHSITLHKYYNIQYNYLALLLDIPCTPNMDTSITGTRGPKLANFRGGVAEVNKIDATTWVNF